ncbi:hypothetical protein ILUMI_17033, partial [Ignelater luminosus]
CPNKKCSNFFTLPVTSENLTCSRCKKKISLKDYIAQFKTIGRQYEEANEALDAQEPGKAIVLLCQAIDSFH